MSTIRWSGFQGENRAIEPKLLPDAVGTVSRNQKPGRGDLRPWREPLAVAAVPAGRETIYRMGRDVASDAEYWLSWPTVVHAIRGFSADDTTEQTFYTGDGAPKVTNNILALATTPYPTTSRPMGIPAPGAPCLIETVSAASTADVQDFYYTYTFVSDWGWESGPAAPSLVNSRPSDLSATISGFSAIPSGNHGIDRIRIYRTQSGGSGDAAFFFLREIAIGTASTTDDNRPLGEVMATTTYLPAPDDLSHLSAMWNGMAAGISGGAVRFCESYVPYAWPIAYEAIPPDSQPVALGVFGQTLLVLTNGRPLLVAGSGPDSMDQQPLEFSQGCIAPRSVVSMGAGVAWASSDGLCWYGSGGPRILTAGIMLRDDWQAMNPASIVGQMYEGLYFGSYDAGSGRQGFFINPGEPSGMYFMDAGYTAMHFDELQDQLYVLDGVNIKRWDAGIALMTVRARSKVFRSPAPVSFSLAEVVASSYPVTLRIDMVNMEADTVTKAIASGSGQFTAPTSTSLRYERSVPSRLPVRLPSGYLETDWQLEVETTGAIQGVAVSTSMKEIAQV